MTAHRCDLCGEVKECIQKEIDGKEYDLCSECWTPLAAKLSGKGRVKKNRETVFLPPVREKESEADEPEPAPGRPPIICSAADRPN